MRLWIASLSLLALVGMTVGCADEPLPALTNAENAPVTPEYHPNPDQWPLQLNRIAKGTPVAPQVRVRLRNGGGLSIETSIGWGRRR